MRYEFEWDWDVGSGSSPAQVVSECQGFGETFEEYAGKFMAEAWFGGRFDDMCLSTAAEAEYRRQFRAWLVATLEGAAKDAPAERPAQLEPKAPWRSLLLWEGSGDYDHPTYCFATMPEQTAAKLREFQKTGGMDGTFFAHMGFAHEKEDDASTWGPASPDDVDWTGFPS